jgi:hypothetical protein
VTKVQDVLAFGAGAQDNSQQFRVRECGRAVFQEPLPRPVLGLDVLDPYMVFRHVDCCRNSRVYKGCDFYWSQFITIKEVEHTVSKTYHININRILCLIITKNLQIYRIVRLHTITREDYICLINCWEKRNLKNTSEH